MENNLNKQVSEIQLESVLKDIEQISQNSVHLSNIRYFKAYSIFCRNYILIFIYKFRWNRIF